jgi:hypothetical protein
MQGWLANGGTDRAPQIGRYAQLRSPHSADTQWRRAGLHQTATRPVVAYTWKMTTIAPTMVCFATVLSSATRSLVVRALATHAAFLLHVMTPVILADA